MNSTGNMTVQNLPTLLTSGQVCAELGISRVTLWRLVSGGQIKSLRVSRRCVRFHRDELEAFLDRARVAERERVAEVVRRA